MAIVTTTADMCLNINLFKATYFVDDKIKVK